MNQLCRNISCYRNQPWTSFRWGAFFIHNIFFCLGIQVNYNIVTICLRWPVWGKYKWRKHFTRFGRRKRKSIQFLQETISERTFAIFLNYHPCQPREYPDGTKLPSLQKKFIFKVNRTRKWVVIGWVSILKQSLYFVTSALHFQRTHQLLQKLMDMINWVMFVHIYMNMNLLSYRCC